MEVYCESQVYHFSSTWYQSAVPRLWSDVFRWFYHQRLSIWFEWASQMLKLELRDQSHWEWEKMKVCRSLDSNFIAFNRLLPHRYSVKQSNWYISHHDETIVYLDVHQTITSLIIFNFCSFEWCTSHCQISTCFTWSCSKCSRVQGCLL